jgi:hypothetical protein
MSATAETPGGSSTPLDLHGLPPEAAVMFAELRGVLQAEGRWSRERDEPPLLRLVVNHFTARHALADACRNPYVTGSHGHGLVAHPGFAVASRCDRFALAAAAALRLTHRTPAKAAEEPDEGDGWAALDELAPRRRGRG